MSDKDTRLSELAHKQLAAEAKVESLELQLQNAKKELLELSERTFPAVMEEYDLDHVKTRDGLEITVYRETLGSIKKEAEEEAFKWLRDNGHGGIIKDKLEATAKSPEELEQMFHILQGFPVRDKSSIHWQTLCKWVRDMLAEGATIPDAIKVSERVTTKVKVKN